MKNCGDINADMIEITSYGDNGDLPKINTNGKGVWYQDYGNELDFGGHVYKGNVSSAIFLYDVENILIKDIEITNKEKFKDMESYCAADKMDRTGVAAVAKNRGTLHSITLDNLFIHDINGNVYNKHMNNGGIYMTALKPIAQNAEAARFRLPYSHSCSPVRPPRPSHASALPAPR